MFNNGVEFDKIFQKEYFDDVLKSPDMSNSGINSFMSSPQRTLGYNNNVIKNIQQDIRKS